MPGGRVVILREGDNGWGWWMGCLLRGLFHLFAAALSSFPFSSFVLLLLFFFFFFFIIIIYYYLLLLFEIIILLLLLALLLLLFIN